MTRTIYYAASTLNGFLATSDDSLRWLLDVPQEDVQSSINEFTDHIGVRVQGSTTYEWVVRQSALVEHPERWQEFSGGRPTYVFTSRELPIVPGADVRFVSGGVATHFDEIAEAAGGRDIWVLGGGELAGQFLDAGLLDEIVVTFAPALLRTGKPFLPRNLDWHGLALSGVRQHGHFAELTYQVNSVVNSSGAKE